MEILAKYNRDVISKVHIFCLLFNQTFGHSWALISTNELSWALMSTHEQLWAFWNTHGHSGTLKITQEYGSMVPRACLSAHYGSCQSGTMLMRAHKGSWELKNAHECSLVLISVISDTMTHSWVLMSIHEHSWAFLSSHEPLRALMSIVPLWREP